MENNPEDAQSEVWKDLVTSEKYNEFVRKYKFLGIIQYMHSNKWPVQNTRHDALYRKE